MRPDHFCLPDYRAVQPRVTKWGVPWVLNAFSWVFLWCRRHSTPLSQEQGWGGEAGRWEPGHGARLQRGWAQAIFCGLFGAPQVCRVRHVLSSARPRGRVALLHVRECPLPTAGQCGLGCPPLQLLWTRSSSLGLDFQGLPFKVSGLLCRRQLWGRRSGGLAVIPRQKWQPGSWPDAGGGGRVSSPGPGIPARPTCLLPHPGQVWSWKDTAWLRNSPGSLPET